MAGGQEDKYLRGWEVDMGGRIARLVGNGVGNKMEGGQGMGVFHFNGVGGA